MLTKRTLLSIAAGALALRRNILIESSLGSLTTALAPTFDYSKRDLNSQGATLSVLTHPVAGSQLSLVQGLLSSHFLAVPAAHFPALQVSLTVQAEPSEQPLVLLT